MNARDIQDMATALATEYNRQELRGLQALRHLLFEVCLRLHDENTGADELLALCNRLIEKECEAPREDL